MLICEIIGLGCDDEQRQLVDLLGISEKLAKNEMKLEKALQSINELDRRSTKR